MSRDDLLVINKRLVKEVTEKAVRHSPDAILIIVSNPLDAMCHVAYEASGFPGNRVALCFPMGMVIPLFTCIWPAEEAAIRQQAAYVAV